MNELVREALRRYLRERLARYASVSDWAAALARLQANANANGAIKLTRREIEAEIASLRRRGIRKTISEKPEQLHPQS